MVVGIDICRDALSKDVAVVGFVASINSRITRYVKLLLTLLTLTRQATHTKVGARAFTAASVSNVMDVYSRQASVVESRLCVCLLQVVFPLCPSENGSRYCRLPESLHDWYVME